MLKNYPLNDFEKYKYAQVLALLASNMFRLNDIEATLKYSMRSLDPLNDLFDSFHILNLDKRFKTPKLLLQINYQLSEL